MFLESILKSCLAYLEGTLYMLISFLEKRKELLKDSKNSYNLPPWLWCIFLLPSNPINEINTNCQQRQQSNNTFKTDPKITRLFFKWKLHAYSEKSTCISLIIKSSTIINQDSFTNLYSCFWLTFPNKKINNHQNLWKFLYLSSYVSHLQIFIKQQVIQKNNGNLVIKLH